MAAGSTPSDRWNSKREELRKRCQKISGLSDGIRYAGAINRHGRTLAGVIRSGTRPLLGPDGARNEFFLASAMLNMRGAPVRPLGDLDHAVIQHKKVHIVLLKRDDTVYYVSIDAKTRDIPKLIAKIKQEV